MIMLTSCESIQTTSTTIIPNNLVDPVTVPKLELKETAESYIVKLLYVIDKMESDRKAVRDILMQNK